MKKRVWFIFAIVLSVLCVVALLVACSGGKEEESTGVSIAADYNPALIESKINEIAGTNGIYVKLRVQTAATGETSHDFNVALGIKNNIYYYLTEDNEYYFDFSNENYYVTYSKEDGVWTKEVANYNAYVTKALAEQMAKAASAGILGYMGLYSDLSGSAAKSTATVAGRECDKYTFKDSAVSASYSLEVCIDKQTGVCLKYAAAGSAAGERASISLECVEFNTSYSPVLPSVSGQNGANGGDNGTNSNGNQGTGQGTNQNGPGGENGNGENGTSGGTNNTSGQNQGSGEGGNGGQGSGEGGNGEQGSGEVIVPSNFSGKRLNVTNINVQTQDNEQRQEAQEMFTAAYASLFQDGTFELVSNMGILFGTFTVPDNGNVAQLATFKCYDPEENEYFYDFPSTYDSLSLSCVAGAYILHLPVPVANGATMVDVGLTMTASTESPMRSTVPADPNGDSFDARYQVTQERWTDIFTNKALLNNCNFTVAYSSTAAYSAAGTLMVDGNKYASTWINGNVYFEKTGSTPDSLGCYPYSYYALNNGTWASSPASYHYAFFDQWIGTLPAPFLDAANYASYLHYYSVSEFRFVAEGESNTRTITNFKVWFSNGNPTKIEFQESGATCTFLFTAYDTTLVSLPTPGSGQGSGQGGSQGSGDPTDLDQYSTALESKVLTFNRVTNGGGLNSSEMTIASAAYQNAEVRIFDENAVEIYYDKLFDYDENFDVVTMLYGTLSFNTYMANNGDPYVKGSIALSATVVDGYVNDDPDESIYVRWYINDSQLRLQMDGGDYFIYFDLTNGTPTHTPIPQAGGEGGQGGSGNENGQGGNGNENGQGGGEGGSSQTTIYTDFGNEYVLRQTVIDLGAGSGIKVVMERGDEDYSTTMTFAAKGGIFCITFEDGDTQYCDMRDLNNITYYGFDYVENQWLAESVSLDEAKQILEFDMLFTYNHMEYDAADRTATTLTVDGKSVNVYQYDFEYGEVMKLDQTTGICLYYVDDDWFEIMRVFLLEGVEDVSLPIL